MSDDRAKSASSWDPLASTSNSSLALFCCSSVLSFGRIVATSFGDGSRLLAGSATISGVGAVAADAGGAVALPFPT